MTRLLLKGNRKLHSHKKEKKTICKTVPCQKKHTLKLLRETNFPQNTSRKNVMRSDQTSYEGFVLGKINLIPYWAKKKGRKQDLSTRTKDPKFKELYRNSIKLLNLKDSDFKFTTIQYNKNQRAAKHKDGRNVGESYIIGLGNYTGGELMIWDKDDKNPVKHDIRNKFLKFNGSEHFHETQPFKGERYTLVFFNV
jgi:hypothetical protein